MCVRVYVRVYMCASVCKCECTCVCTCVHVSVRVDHLDYLIYSIKNVACTYIKYVCKSTSSCIYLPPNNPI